MSPWHPAPDPTSATTRRPEVKYEHRECRLRQMPVWAILTRIGDGDWAVVNCLDKAPACEGCRCAFVQQDGRWPFDEPA